MAQSVRPGVRPDVVVNETITAVVPAAVRRISWGAIIAGVVVSLVAMIAFNLLGLSIGAATVNPMSERVPGEGLGTGAVIWIAASNLLSLFLGGFVAGRMSGLYANEDGILHGIVTWGVTLLLTLFLLTSGVGSAVNAVSNVISSGVSALAGGAAAVAPEVAEAVEQQSITLNSVLREGGQLVIPAPAEGEEPVVVDLENPTVSQQQLYLNIVQYFRTGEDADRQELVDMLAANSNLTEEEINTRVDQWQAAYSEAVADAEATARRVGEDVAEGVAVAAGLLFAALVVGAFAAGAGGMVGAPEPDRRHDD